MGRVLGKVPEPSESGISKLRISTKRIATMLSARNVFERLPYEVILEQYSGAKRTRYERAASELHCEPVTTRDARVSAFVKAEKRKEEDLKDPRMIQFRTPKYNLELATFLKPVEHAILRHRGPRRGVKRSFVIAKGRDSVERAKLIRSKWDQFADPVCVPIDASRFDKHVSVEALKQEHGVYNRLFSDPYLARLLRMQESNKGMTMNGIKYKVRGNRMSGDYNTGMGNCLLMAAMTESIMLELKFARWDYFADADDCLLFVERKDLLRLLDRVSPLFLEFGQEVRIEGVAHEYWDIKHCQGSPVATASGVRMVRDFRKVLSQAFCGHNHYHDPVGGMRVMKSVAQCELILNAGVPILQPLSLKVLELLEPVKMSKLDVRDTISWLALTEARRRHFEWREAKAVEITDDARQSFERVFGVTTPMQLAWEAWVEELTIDNLDLKSLSQRFPQVDQGYY